MSERRSSFDAEMQQEILEIVSSLEEMHIKISSDLVKNLPFPNIESYKDDVIEKGLLSLTDRIEDLQRKLVSNDQQILSLTELCPLSINFCVTSTGASDAFLAMKRMASNENFKASCRALFPTEFDHFSVILEKVKELSVHRTIMQSRRVDLIALREHIEEREEIIAMYRSAMEEQQREKLRAKRLLGTPSPIPSPTTPDRMRTYSAALSLTSKHP